MKVTKESKIAVVAIIGLTVLFFGLKFLKGMNIFSNTVTYTMVFDNIDGLGASTPIYADGYKVGYVGKINYDYEKAGAIYVEAEMDKALRIPKGSSAEISSDLMGNMKVNLLMANNPREALTPNDVIDGRIYSGALGKVADMVPAIEQMLPKLDSILASVNVLLASPALANSLDNIETVTGNLRTTTAEANRLMATLNGAVPQLAGKAGAVLDKADATMANTQRLTDNLARLDIQPTLDMVNTTLANTSSAMAKIDRSMNDVNIFTTNLNNKEGSLGKLMNDDRLYNDLDHTVRSADSLLTDFKARPGRYIHFSVFGKKAK